MAGELIAQMAQNALTNVGPFSNLMAGAQDYNTLQNQLLNNQLLQQRYTQSEQMNPLLMQEAQNKLAMQGQDVTTGQMTLDQAKQGQLIRDMQTIATEALQMPGNARRQHILGRLKTVDFAGLDENELINEIGQLDDTQLEQSLRSMMSAASMGQDQEPMTEYQRRSLEIREKELNQPTVNEKNLTRYQELKKTDPVAARMFGQEVGLLPPDKNLSSTAEKSLTDSTQKYYDLTKQAREYELLADDFQRFASELPSGAAATVSEFFKSYTGSQDEATELRRKLNRVRLSEGLKYLPPGPATDRDVEEAYKGVPKETASPEQVQMFLRGAAKMAAIDADFEEFKSNYISQFNSVQGLIPAWKEEIAQGRVQSINDLQPKKDEAPRATRQQSAPQATGGQTNQVKFLGFEE